jgi:segregation and condensation protein B
MTEEKTVMTEEELFQNARVLEAVLFTSAEPITENDVNQLFPADTDIESLFQHLQAQYQNRGVNLVKRGRGWALRTSPDMAERLQVKKIEIKSFSRAAVETLAIVAYHQPVTRAEVEQIRGVNISKSTFEILVAENLIKPGKRRDVVGRPLTWITTQAFLDSFGLENLKQLPNLQELKEAGLLSMQAPTLSDMPQPSLPLVSEEGDEGLPESDEDFEAAFEEEMDAEQGEAA